MRLRQKHHSIRSRILFVSVSLLFIASLGRTEQVSLQPPPSSEQQQQELRQQAVEYRVSTLPSPSDEYILTVTPISQTSSPPSPTPAPPSAPPIQEVFVPLQKWKEQKLLDIESRVKRDKAILKKASTHSSERNGYQVRLLSKKQIAFRQLLSRTCSPHDEAGINQTTFTRLRYSVKYPSITPVIVVQNPSKVPAVESAEVTFATAVDDAQISDKNASSFSKDNNFEYGPSTPIETPVAVDHSPAVCTDATQDGSPEVTGEKLVTDANNAPSSTPSVADIDMNPEDKAPTPLLKKIEKKVRSIRDTVTTAVNLSHNAAKVRNLRDSVSTTFNVSQGADECTNCSSKAMKNDESTSASPEIVAPTKTPDMDSVVDQLKKGSDENDDLSSAAKEPVKMKRTLFNFASEIAGAQILASSPNTMGAKNIITENSDKYMLVPCVSDSNGGSRWVDIELSEDAFLTSVQTANFEHYSSTARKFAVLGSENYPPKQWNVLGVFDFEDTRAVQTFHITGTMRKVTRFLRVVYAGRHGHEYYCPISIFRAFGKNLIADLKDSLEPQVEKAPHNMHVNDEVKMKGPASDSVTEKEKGERKDNEKIDDPPATPKTDDASRDSGIDSGANSAQSTSDKTKSADARSHKRSGSELSPDDQILLNAVREQTLSPVSGDDNIFRRVARMIRLLELNQSLTNQYIDTHLASFAVSLSAARKEAALGRIAADLAEARAAGVADQLERAIVDMNAATLRRDMLMCALMVCIGFLLGTHWVMWTALSARAGGNLEDVVSPISSPEGSSVSMKPENERGGAPKGRIVETMSVDGVHVQMKDVRPKRRRRRRSDSHNGGGGGGAMNSPQSNRTTSGRSGLPPIGVSPSKMRPLFTSNSFQALSAASDGEREKFASRNT